VNYHRGTAVATFEDSIRVISFMKILAVKKQLLSYCCQQRILYLHSLDDGKIVAWKRVDWMERTDCWGITRDEKYLIGGGREGTLALFSVDGGRFFLEDKMTFLGKKEIMSLAIVEERKTEFLIVGLSNGITKVFPFRS